MLTYYEQAIGQRRTVEGDPAAASRATETQGWTPPDIGSSSASGDHLCVENGHPVGGEQCEAGVQDEHRVGLKPILRRSWAPKGTRPTAMVNQKDERPSLYAFVHPTTGCPCPPPTVRR